MFGLVKGKLLAIGAGFIAVLLGVIKFLAVRNKSLKEQVKDAKASIRYRDDIAILDEELGERFSHKATLAKEALEQDEIPPHLRDRN